MDKRIIAIHLPQFYPFKENDEWWGKGFTEWRNTSSAKPRFRGHYQPHIPGDLGYYDLRLHESRKAQQDLARQYGIYGFCYYHYWFNKKLIMEKPIEEMFKNKNETFPFMFCWANANWGRNWEGGNNVTLIEQHYSREDDIAHFNYLLPFLKDSRYIKIEGKPVIAIHCTQLMPDPESTVKLWKELARENGFELYFCRIESQGVIGKEHLTSSMDAAIEFQPFNMQGFWKKHNIIGRILRKMFGREIFATKLSYKDYVNYKCKRKLDQSYKLFPSIFPCWDNSPRRIGRPFLAFTGSTPELFKKWFKHVYCQFKPYSNEENLIFINAWNEWAEGCHLEPDIKYGLEFLESIKSVMDENDGKEKM